MKPARARAFALRIVACAFIVNALSSAVMSAQSPGDATSHAQDAPAQERRTEVPDSLSNSGPSVETDTSSLAIPESTGGSVLDLMLPAFLRVGYVTREWVRDSLPPISTELDEIARVDLIYARAMAEAGGNLDLALVGALFAVFEHQTIPLSFGLKLPLTLEPKESFDRRVAKLPSSLFADRIDGDDRDKLQHFFASALTARMLDNAELADAIGLFIETGEDLFVAGGVNDHRDVRANRLGHIFAEMLVDDPHLLPGVVLRAWNREYTRRNASTR